MAPNHLKAAPEIPTVESSRRTGTIYTSTLYGLWAPKGTPKEVIAKLNAVVVEALANPTVGKKLVDSHIKN